jgi:hypothetical protein
MLSTPFKPEKNNRFYIPVRRNLSQGLILRWISFTAMAVFFFPLTMTAILFNGAGFGLMLAALISIALVTITNLSSLPEKYIIPVFGIGISIDLAVIIYSFVIK